MNASVEEELLGRLKPFLDFARGASGDVMKEVGSTLTEKTVGGLTSLGVRTAGAVHRAIANRFARSRARHRFTKEMAQAGDNAAREAACRRFLHADPFLRQSLAALLERRDYLRALQAYCDELPLIDLVPGNHRLGEVFVTPDLIATGLEPNRSETNCRPERLLDGRHHFVQGEAGSGKSTLGRWLAGRMAGDLLNDHQAPALDQLRLPIYVSAAELSSRSWAQALREASDAQLGLREISPLSAEFFDPRATHGHRQWTVIVDGLDEIDDPKQRRAIWRAITAVHASEADAFRFIVFARPDPAVDVPQQFDRWRIAPLRAPGALVERYARATDVQTSLTALLERRDYREVSRNPLFVAMAAALFERHQTLPSRPHELIEAFVARGLSRAARREPERAQALERLLEHIAEGSARNARELMAAEPTLYATIAPGFSVLEREAELDQRLIETGLVRRSGDGSIRFLHRLIERYFVANALAAKTRPSREVWYEIEPRRLGWAAVEQLCARWVELDLDVEEAITGLSEHGSEARDVVLRLAVHLPDVVDSAFARAFDALVRELEAGEVTALHAELLPGLAMERPDFRRRMISIALRDGYGFTLLPIATALAKAGHFNAIRDAVIRIARDDEQDDHFRYEAAELLLEREKDPAFALEILHDIALQGESGWVRFQAAHRLCQNLDDAETIELLREVVRETYIEGDERLDSRILEALLTLGETELALPLLEEAANPHADDIDFLIVRDAVRAAELLANYDPEAGRVALERTLSQPKRSLRDRAEILRSLDRIEPLGGHRARLIELAQTAPHEVDWRVVDILVDWDEAEVAWTAVQTICRKAFRLPHLPGSVLQALSRVLPMVPEERGADLIREGLMRQPHPELARYLAIVGRSAEARVHLTRLLDLGNFELAKRAAHALARVGNNARAVACLAAIAAAREARPQLRLEAIRELVSLGEVSKASQALRHMIADPSLDFESRDQAAHQLSELLADEDEEVFVALGKIARSRGPIGDRLKAMKTIAELDPYFDYYYLYCQPLRHMVALKGFKSRHLADFSSLARALDADIGDFPKAVVLLNQDELTAIEKLEIIEPFASRVNAKPWAIALLTKIAFDECADLGARVAAIQLLGDAKPHMIDAVIDRLVADSSLPPDWRTALAKAAGSHSAARGLATIAADSTVAIKARLSAYAKLGTRDVATCLPDFSMLADLDIHERLAIAHTAHKQNLRAVVQEQLQACLELGSFSIYELVEIHRVAVSCDCDVSAADASARLAKIPFAIMERNEDTATVLDAIAVIAATDEGLALDRLTALLNSDEMSIWSVPSVLEAMAAHRSRGDVQRLAIPVIGEAIEALESDDPYPGAMLHAVEPLYQAGWIEEFEPLMRLARDPARSLSQRIGAAVLALNATGTAHSEAYALLRALVESKIDNVADAIQAAISLSRGGYDMLSLQLLETCLTIPSLRASDRLHIAVHLKDLGRRADALQLVYGIDLDALQDAFLLDGDMKLLSDAFGSKRIDEFRETRMAATDNEIDRLMDARDRVIEKGSRGALAMIQSVAADDDAHPADRLEAVDILDQLGFRALSRTTFDAIDLNRAEPLWVAEQAARFGRKADALKYFECALVVETTNLHLVHAGFADLGIVVPATMVEALGHAQVSV